jgi:hypothetical protein
MIIRGKIDTVEGTVKLYKWAMISGSDPECYKKITVELIKDNQLLRRVSFSKAFVVDYSEEYSNHAGTGTFTLYVKQFLRKDIECDGPTAKATFEKVSSIEEVEEAVEEAVEEVKKQSSIDEKSTKRKSVMSITDRIAKQKKMGDNNTGVNEVDKDGTQPRYGDRRISDELYDELRARTPSKKIQKMVNKGNKIGAPDPALPGKTITGTLQADHIVPMDKITRMEGFEKLTPKQQIEVLNYEENFIGISEAANLLQNGLYTEKKILKLIQSLGKK